MEETIRIKHGDKVILLGDYVDRGTQSKEVVDYIIELQDKGFDVISLLGNHEAMLLDAYKNNDAVPLWIQNGGAETLKSFGINSPTNLQSKYIDFFKSLNLFYSIEEYLFVHAGFNDSIENPFEDTYHMIWKCRDH
ncbi:MAG: serine/threonine protein phosphatase, partial [Bacteroidetes bacterium CG_4_10_14_3_um_filter_42_6]